MSKMFMFQNKKKKKDAKIVSETVAGKRVVIFRLMSFSVRWRSGMGAEGVL